MYRCVHRLDSMCSGVRYCNDIIFRSVSVIVQTIRTMQTTQQHKYNGQNSRRTCEKTKTLALHREFYEKINLWKKLLKDEVTADVDELKDLLAEGRSVLELQNSEQISGSLKYHSQSFHPIYGRTLTLKPSPSTNKIGKLFRVGTPVMLCRSEDLRCIQECVVLSCSARGACLKSKKKEEIKLNPRLNYVLLPSSGLGYLLAVDEFLEIKWRDFPGEKLVHHVHCATPIPFPRSDDVINDDCNLNEDQKRAVAAALNSTRPLTVIQGPPGTGKTAVIAEIITRSVLRKQKVLICSPSNVAVNNIVNRINKLSGICTLGFNSSFSLANEIEQHGDFDDIQGVFDTLNSDDRRKGKDEKKCRNAEVNEANKLLSNLRENIVSRKSVVACTLTNSSLRALHSQGFRPHLVIIDEAAQALECIAWYSLLLAPRAVIVGDQWQLSPVLKTLRPESKVDIGCSLMDAVMSRFGDTISFFLTEQYRMNEKIMGWSSQYFYKGRLRAHSTVSKQLLSDVSNVPSASIFNEPLLMINSDGCETTNNRDLLYHHSYSNPFEAGILVHYVKILLKYGVRKESVGIISPYTAQVDLIRRLLNVCEVNSVDAFQGQEKEVVVMSLVRKNEQGKIGFLMDDRRLNVAVTRARRQFVLIGSSEMMKRAKHLLSLLHYIQKWGRTISADDFMQLNDTANMYIKKKSERLKN